MAIFSRLKKFDPEKEKKLRDEIEAEGGLEKNDFLAMVLGACIVILPAALIGLALVALLIFLII